MGRYLDQIQCCSSPPLKKQNGQHTGRPLQATLLGRTLGVRAGALLQSVDGTGKRNSARAQSLPLLMGTQPRVCAPGRPGRAVVLLLALGTAAACGGGPNNAAGHTPSPLAGSPTPNASPTSQAGSTPAPQPVHDAYGVLVSRPRASIAAAPHGAVCG